MKPKTLIFESKGINELRQNEWACSINVLHMDNHPKYTPARYTITDSILSEGKYTPTFWAMNRGIGVRKDSSFDEAIKACQEHFNRLIYENCDVGEGNK